MKPYIKITKTKAKQPFQVRHIGTNGKQLGQPETYTRKESAFKSIMAYLELFNGRKVLVEDHAWDNIKEGKPNIGDGPWRFWLKPDGSRVFKNIK